MKALATPLTRSNFGNGFLNSLMSDNYIGLSATSTDIQWKKEKQEKK